jgi:uncharacterized protein (TIGR01777 family)
MKFVRSTALPHPAAEVFRWHERPGAFLRLQPPWESVRLLRGARSLRDGEQVELEVRLGPLRRRWLSEHRDYVAGRQFRDVQVSGPFARWVHTHSMEPQGEAASRLEDRIDYALPLGALGRLLGGRLVRRKLDRMFAYRHRITAQDLKAHARAGGKEPMKVLISGATGLVGSALVPFLTTGGHEAARLSRRAGPEDVAWDPVARELDAGALEGMDGVVHLAGENIAGRWTAARKERIRRSRIDGTRLLAERLASLDRKPRVLVCASAIGYYGDRGDEILREDSPAGSGFLAEVCREWEAAAEPARRAGIRVVHLRFGVILTSAGGALAQMLTPFRMGLGGRVGSGRQYLSWVSLDDAVGAIHHALTREGLHGPVNVVAPRPVTNLELTRTLGRVLSRPTLFPLPAFAARLVFGEMADALLLASARVVPERLQAAGYEFRHPDLEGALRHVLGR